MNALPSPLALILRRIDDHLAACRALKEAAWLGGPAYDTALNRHALTLSHMGASDSDKKEEAE